jgi:hypothetical protein
MEENLRNELQRADAEAARETAREEARAARDQAARNGREQIKAELANATTPETESNVRGCPGSEGAITGTTKYNPAPIEEQSDFEWTGGKPNNAKMLDEPWTYEEAGAATTKSEEDYKNNLLLKEQHQKRPPPERDRGGRNSEGAKRQRVPPKSKSAPSTGYREGVLDSKNLLYPLDTIRYPVDGGKS